MALYAVAEVFKTLLIAVGAAADAVEPYLAEDDTSLSSSSIPSTPSPSLASSFYHERHGGDKSNGTLDNRPTSLQFDIDKLIDALTVLKNEETESEAEESFIPRSVSKSMAATLNDSLSNVRALARALEFQLDQNVNAETG